MFDLWFACGECIPPSPSKVRKVFEIERIGLDFGMLGSDVPVRGGAGSGAHVKYPRSTHPCLSVWLGERKKAVRA
jgi:hypothetical protein